MAINWETKHLVQLKRVGYGATTAPLSAIFDDEFATTAEQSTRPGLLWFLSLEPNAKAEKAMFDDQSVVVSSRWFNNGKVYVEDISDKAEREKYAKVVPTLIFLDSKGNEVTRLVGSVTANQVFAAQQKVAALEYKDSLMTLVNRYQDFLRKLDKAASEVTDLEAEAQTRRDHIAKHDCAPGRKALKEAEEDLGPAKAGRDKLLATEGTYLAPARLGDAPKAEAKPTVVGAALAPSASSAVGR